MTKKQPLLVLLTMCLLSLGGSLAIASTPPPPPPPPPVVTVTDNFGSNHGNYLRWEQFSTDLSASIANAPQSTTETTISGPTYQWNIISQNPSSPTFYFIDSGNGNATLQSPTPSKSVCFVAAGGTYTVTVNCTITYTSTDNKTNVATPLSYSADPPLTVTFFVRIPYNVVQTANKIQHTFNGPNANGTPQYGHYDNYNLEIQDNQTQPQAYGGGLPRESFSNITQLDPGEPASAIMEAASTWNYNQDGTGNPTSDFVDQIAAGPIDSDPYSDGLNHILFAVDQTWHCMELTPPYNAPNASLYLPSGKFNPQSKPYPTASDFLPNVNDTTLNGGQGSIHHLADHFGYGVRQYPGDPYPN